MEIGIHTFGELVPDPHTHQKISAHERLKNVIHMAIMALALTSKTTTTCLPKRSTC